MKTIKEYILLFLILSSSLVLKANTLTSNETINSKSIVNINSIEDIDTETEKKALEGKTLKFKNTLYVKSNYSWIKYGQVTLSSKRRYTPTEIYFPGSDNYYNELENIEMDEIILDDGSDEVYPKTIPWKDKDGTLRMGSKVDNLTARLVNTKYGWNLIPVETPYFYGNERPSSLKDLDDDKIRVCGFNLLHYITSNFGSGFGPENKEESDKQHNKTSKALIAINADIYAVCEVQTGQDALKKLTDALNSNAGRNVYSFINDGTSVSGSYSKVGYIYRSDKLNPIKSIKGNDYYLKNRKKAQGFTYKKNGGSFIVLMNHFKAKSGNGTGDNEDQNDGQGGYNYTRTKEAESTVTFAEQCITYYNDNDILILGDLNSYSMEDPIQTLEEEDYTNLLYKFQKEDNDVYSYAYYGNIGLLDHAYANPSMAAQVTNSYVYHINTDEPSYFEYSGYGYNNDMYRSSDHDPVIVEMRINETDTSITPPSLGIVYNQNNKGEFTIINAKNHFIDIYNLNGIKLYSSSIKEDSKTLNAQNLNLHTGMYIIKLTEAKVYNANSEILKLIISTL